MEDTIEKTIEKITEKTRENPAEKAIPDSPAGFLQEINIMEVGGFKVGHAQDSEGVTGCTAVLFDRQSPAGVDIRGGGPASRETPLLNPTAYAMGVHAVLLSGGSAFGLDAAGGVMKYLEERDIGFDVGVTKVPLVVQSSLFDLTIGDKNARPDQQMGYEACENASYEPMKEGNAGAGMGCTVGKYRGPKYCMKSGIGSFAVAAGDLKIGAIVAVNALGDVYDIDTGREIAGLLDDQGKLRPTELELWGDAAGMYKAVGRNADQASSGSKTAEGKNTAEKNTAERKNTAEAGNTNTTLGLLITNGKLDKTLLNKAASMAHNGYARAIRPVHTTADGDSIYAVSTGDLPCDINVVGTLGAYVMGKAINRAVLAAESICGLPAAGDLS